MWDLTVNILILGLYVMAICYLIPSRANGWVVNWLDELQKEGKCHPALVLTGILLAMVLWPITQLAYAFYVERMDEYPPRE